MAANYAWKFFRAGGFNQVVIGSGADLLNLDIKCVSIKGKTNEGVGALGRGEAIAVHAIALLRSR